MGAFGLKTCGNSCRTGMRMQDSSVTCGKFSSSQLMEMGTDFTVIGIIEIKFVLPSYSNSKPRLRRCSLVAISKPF